MLYRKMPKTGDKLSILGFGCMRLPMAEGKIDEGRAIAQIRGAIDKGVNYVDTAWPYLGGASEPLLGKALRESTAFGLVVVPARAIGPGPGREGQDHLGCGAKDHGRAPGTPTAGKRYGRC